MGPTTDVLWLLGVRGAGFGLRELLHNIARTCLGSLGYNAVFCGYPTVRRHSSDDEGAVYTYENGTL